MPTDTELRKKKRKRAGPPPDGPATDRKRPREATTQQPSSLLAPHEAALAALAPKYDVLAASVISSTQIRKRVGYVTTHLLAPPLAQQRPRVVMLHARTADVCKLITVVEQAKRVLCAEGRAWFQYNQMFELPGEAGKKKEKKAEAVEETVLEREEDDDEDDDDFEVMESRFEKAVLPPPPARVTKSMRVFLSVTAVSELRSEPGVTVQSSDEARS